MWNRAESSIGLTKTRQVVSKLSMEMHAFRMNNVGLGDIKNSAISVPQLVTDGARESVRVF